MEYPVLRAITRLNIGGPARQANLLTQSLAAEFPTTLVAGRPERGEGELRERDVPVTYVSLARNVSPVSDVRAVTQLRNLIRSSRPNLVHTHMAKAGALGRIAALTASPRAITVHTFHGHVLEGYFSKPMQEAFIRAERSLARRTDALIAVSTEVRDDLLRLGIGDASRWHVIPLGFDLSSLLDISMPSGVLRDRLNLSPDIPLVGVLGRLAPIKDHETLLRALAKLDGVHLVVFGDGEMRERLASLILELGIGDRVHMLGWWMDLPLAFSDLNLVVLTSRNEGTPVSLIEALAAGRTVVATDVGGVRSVVDDGETGLLVPPGDQAAIADAIGSLLENGDLRKSMGELGRSRVAVRFDKERLISDIKELYRSLLG